MSRELRAVGAIPARLRLPSSRSGPLSLSPPIQTLRRVEGRTSKETHRSPALLVAGRRWELEDEGARCELSTFGRRRRRARPQEPGYVRKTPAARPATEGPGYGGRRGRW